MTVNWSVRVSRRDEGTDQSVVQPLMIPFVVVVVHELAHRVAQRAFADEDQPLDAGFLDGADEAFGEGVQIGRARGQPDRGHARGRERVADGVAEEGVTVVDEPPRATQKPILGIGDVPHELGSPTAHPARR